MAENLSKHPILSNICACPLYFHVHAKLTCHFADRLVAPDRRHRHSRDLNDASYRFRVW